MYLRYNDFGSVETPPLGGDWEYVRIETWNQEPVIDEDQVSQVTTRYVATGTAVISAEDPQTFRNLVDEARSKLNQPRKELDIRLGGTAVGDRVVYIEAGGDDQEGPFFRFDVARPINARSSVVTFQIEWFEYEPVGLDDRRDVLVNRWSSAVQVNENNMSVYRVQGTLSAWHNSPNDGFWDGSRDVSSDDPVNFDLGNNPDRYRDVVLPILPKGFRVASMEFAVSESGDSLAYSIVANQYARVLPHPAKAGNADFFWSKDAGLTPNGMLGVKRAEISLEADPNTSPADLLASATFVAKEFIDFDQDRILTVEFAQTDAFTANRIELNLTAQSLGGAADSQQPNDDRQPRTFGAANVQFVKLGEIIEQLGEAGQQIGSQYQPPGPYTVVPGSTNADDPSLPQIVYEIRKRILYQPDESSLALPIAHVDEVGPRDVQELIYTVPDAKYVDLADRLDPGNNQPGANNKAAMYIKSRSRERVVAQDAGMRVMRSQSLSAVDKIFQIRKPRAVIHSEIVMGRLNEPPQRQILDLPGGAVVHRESFEGGDGFVDSNGNRIYLAVHRRLIEMSDFGANQGFENKTVALPAAGPGAAQAAGLTYRSWWPVNNQVGFPFDPLVEDIGTGPNGEFQAGRDIWTPTNGESGGGGGVFPPPAQQEIFTPKPYDVGGRPTDHYIKPPG